MSTIDWPPSRKPPRRRGRLLLFIALAVIFFGSSTFLSYYVESLWFDSLGFASVFWKTIRLQSVVFSGFFLATFLALYGAFLALKPAQLGELANRTIFINGQPFRLPVEPVLRTIVIVAALGVALITGLGLASDWMTFALYWYGGANPTSASSVLDPVFAKPLTFYLFTLPAWQLLAGWLTTLAVIACAAAVFFAAITGGTRLLTSRGADGSPTLRGVSITFGLVLLMFAAQVYLGRFDRLFQEGTTFSGVTYTDAHITLTGLVIVAFALVLGAVIALVNAVVAPKVRWLIASVVPAIVSYAAVAVISWYVSSFIVKPNELVRETPFIRHNIELTRQAYALNRVRQEPFPAETTVEAVDAADNQETLRNIRLWDWRALQDTLRQIQEIRTYYDFPDIDIDRYEIDGSLRQVMLGTRELNIERLPESSRNWINEKLIYTHGYGITMNPVNGFTSEGLPTLLLGNMPVQAAPGAPVVTRPEIYFGEVTNNDVYVRTRQKEFNYPQGETNNLTSYEGSGGILVGGLLRRLAIALDRGDIAKLPFSDDVTPETRLLMRRNVRERVEALAPFVTFDPDPYIIVGDGGRLFWMMDGFTTSDSYPYARHYGLGNSRINYLRNSIKAVIDAYDGTVSFYVFDDQDPLIAAYRGMFPALFKSGAEMPPTLRKHVRYPELMLRVQAAVYGLYHMTDPEVFYNREDLWTVATEVGMNDQRQQAQQPMDPNFVLMKLPGESATEFVEILPFTPANRNNLIGWIAGRSDDPNYGTSVVYDFPKTRLVDGPLQIEARVDQNAQLSGQLSLWNQQGSHVRRGSLIVIPVGRALLYAEPIYLQAERSPMPELRIVVLALQDRLAYGPTFETALSALFGNALPSLPSAGAAPGGTAAPQVVDGSQPGNKTQAPASASGQPARADRNTLIANAARALTDYQRLTAEGKLAEAGQKLQELKQTLEELQK